MGDIQRQRGARVRLVRGKDSQAAAAEKCGMSQGSWSKLERGISRKSSLLADIAKCYCVRIEWLLDGAGSMYAGADDTVAEKPPRSRLARYAPVLEKQLRGQMPEHRLRALACIVEAIVEKKISDDDLASLEALVNRFTAH